MPIGANPRAAYFLGLLAAGLLFPLAATTQSATVEAPAILGGDPKLGPHHVRLLAGGSELEFSGDMSAGSAQELRNMLDANPGVGVVDCGAVDLAQPPRRRRQPRREPGR